MDAKIQTTRTHIYLRALLVVMCAAVLVGSFMLTNIRPTFCTADTDMETVSGVISGVVTDLATQGYRIMRSVVLPIVVCFIAWAGLLFVGGGKNGPEKAFSILKGCGFAVLFVALAPIAGRVLGNLVSGYGTGDLSDYNPLA